MSLDEQTKRWTIIIHGGAKQIDPSEETDNREGLHEAVQAGGIVLAAGGTAIAAVEAAIQVMEDRPVFNAGTGSVRNSAGEIEMCAGLMDGQTLAVGAVAAIREVRHPVSVARELLPEQEILLVGDGAQAFARARQAELQDEDADAATPIGRRAGAGGAHDTVGAVALDRDGNFAAGTSTGGLEDTLPGRVGDSPLPGCGFYADNAVGAVSLSGDGEEIARLALAARIIENLGEQPVAAALDRSLARLAPLGAEAGAIALDLQGTPGFAHNTPHFAVAVLREGEDAPVVWLSKHEEREK